MNIIQKDRHKKTLLTLLYISILVALLAIATYFIGAKYGWLPSWKDADTSTTTELRSTNDVDYSGPSETDIEHSQDGKKNSSSNETDEQSKSVTTNTPVAIAFADVSGDNVEVRAFIPGVIEGTGTCTVSLSKDSYVVTKTSKAFIDASTSQCTTLLVPLSELQSSGIWSLRVSYSSPTHTGESSPVEIAI